MCQDVPLTKGGLNMPFNPKSEYTIVSTEISVKDFFEYKEDYVTRPPYQRKSVWSKKKKQSLMDSLIFPQESGQKIKPFF